jgi:hypothetical protein
MLICESIAPGMRLRLISSRLASSAAGSFPLAKPRNTYENNVVSSSEQKSGQSVRRVAVVRRQSRTSAIHAYGSSHSRIRFLTGEVSSPRRRDGRSWLAAADGASGFRSCGSIGPRFDDLAATAISARSARPCRQTSAIAVWLRSPRRALPRAGAHHFVPSRWAGWACFGPSPPTGGWLSAQSELARNLSIVFDLLSLSQERAREHAT